MNSCMRTTIVVVLLMIVAIIGAANDVHSPVNQMGVERPESRSAMGRDPNAAKAIADLPSEVVKLLPPPILKAEGAEFGIYVAIDGHTMVVGVADDERGTRAGAAYIFEKGSNGGQTWEIVRRLEAPDATPWAYFGRGVAVSGDTVFIGAPAKYHSLFSPPGDHSYDGAVYVFERDRGGADQWGLVTKITSEGACTVTAPIVYGGGTVECTYGEFGFDVAISVDTLIVGAPSGFGTGDHSGTAFVFERDQGGQDAWGPVVQIDFDDGDPYTHILGSGTDDGFGRSVAIDGDTIVIGAYGDDDQGRDTGAAYVFERNNGGADNWGQKKKMSTSAGDDAYRLGWSVAVDGSIAVVGARYGVNTYLLDGNMGWALRDILVAPDGAEGDHFGYAVAINDHQITVGAYGHEAEDGADGYGAAYLFGDADEPWVWTMEQKFRPENVVGDNCFGGWIGISGSNWVVGDPCEEIDGTYSGTISTYHEVATDQWARVEKLRAPASSTARGDRYGKAVAVSGSVMIVGVPNNDVACLNCGAVAVFRADGEGPGTWRLEQTLYASDGSSDDRFGVAVAVDGATIVVGSSAYDDAGESSGSAYVFQTTNGGTEPWAEVAKITASDGESEDYFGFSVSISGDTIVVGAYGDDDLGDHSGAVYLFQKDEGGIGQWGQVTKIRAEHGSERDSFGWALALVGGTLVVGAYGDDELAEDSGAAYVFERDRGGFNAWGLVTKILPEEGEAEDRFGYAVAASGNTIVVGAHGRYYYDYDSYISIYSRDLGGFEAWNLETSILRINGCHFGLSLAVSGDTVMVGCPSFLWSGAVALYRKHLGGFGQWGSLGLLEGSDLWIDEGFGGEVAIDRNTLVIGAPYDDVRGEESGSVYVFEAPPRSAERDLVTFER